MSKPTKDEFLKLQADFYDDHVMFHAADAFCGTAGEAEMKHINELVSRLSDAELQELIKRGGIHFGGGEFDRDSYECVIDEIGRDAFYAIYQDLLAARK